MGDRRCLPSPAPPWVPGCSSPPRSHAAACRTSSCSMVFSISSSSNIPPAPLASSLASSSSSISVSSSVSSSGTIWSHRISTSTSSKCFTTACSNASRKVFAAGVSTSANAARRYWHCRALFAVLCGILRSNTPRSTVADKGTSVRIWVMAPTTMTVVSAADRGGGPMSPSPRAEESSSMSTDEFLIGLGDWPLLMNVSSSSSNRPAGYPRGGRKDSTSISRHVASIEPVCVLMRLTQNCTTSLAMSSWQSQSEVPMTRRRSSSCSRSSSDDTFSPSTSSISLLWRYVFSSPGVAVDSPSRCSSTS